MLDSAEIGFRKLSVDDMPLMHKWLNTDFVIQWYGKKRRSLEEVTEHYATRVNGEMLTKSFLILYEESPIGYIQAYRIQDDPDYSACVQLEEDAAGVDLFIGEEDYIHKGLGAVVLKKFLSEIVFESFPVESCIIGPEPENKVAIRAYEKAGFRYLKTAQVTGEDQPEYLMRVGKEAAT